MDRRQFFAAITTALAALGPRSAAASGAGTCAVPPAGSLFADGFETGAAAASAGGAAATVPASILNQSGSTAIRFSAGMSFRQGDIPAGHALTCADLTGFQGIVLNRWPDCSVKFAVVAGIGTQPNNATTPIRVSGAVASLGPPVAESVLAAAAPNAVITLGGVGSVALADLIGMASTLSGGRYTAGRVRTNFEGPLCSSWTYYSRIAGHPHLSAWFEVRCWSDGAYEILPWVENGWWNVAAPTAWTGTASFTLNGAVRYSGALSIYSYCRPALLGADPQPYRVGANFATLLHDPPYLQTTRLVKRYWAAPNAAKLASLGQTYTPMAAGNEAESTIPNVMGSGGFSPTIGLLSESDVCLVTSADPRALRNVLLNAHIYGRFPVHYRDETTNRVVALGAYPTWCLNSTNTGIASLSASGTNSYTPAIVGPHTSYFFADSHHPSAGYLAYLATGWHYHIETTQAVAAVCGYRMNSVHRQGADHLLRGEGLTGTVSQRGHAWALRTWAQAAALTPDGDPLQIALVDVIAANMDRNHAIYVAQPSNPFGFIADWDAYSPSVNGTVQAGATGTVIPLGPTAVNSPNAYITRGPWTLTIGGVGRTVVAYNPTTRAATVSAPFPSVPAAGVAWNLGNNKTEIPAWMHDFVTMAWGYTSDVAPIPAPLRAKMGELFEWKARSAIGRMGTPGVATAFNYIHAAQFELPAFPTDDPDVLGNTGPFYPHWGAIYQATMGAANTAHPTGGDVIDPSIGSWPGTQGSWAILIAALGICAEHGAVGADVALARVHHDPLWATFLSNLASSPVWGIRPRDAEMPLASQAVGTVIDYSINRISDIDPGPTRSREGDFTQAGLAELFAAWGGIGWHDHGSRASAFGAGHGSGCLNAVPEFDAYTRRWSIVKQGAAWSVVRLTFGAKTWKTESTSSVIALQPNLSSATAGAYVGWTITLRGETRTCVGYEGGSVRRVTVDAPFSFTPVDEPYLLTNGSTTIGHVAQAGTSATSIVLPSTASTTDNEYYAWIARIGGGSAVIPFNAYSGATRTIALTSPIAGSVAGRPVHIECHTGYIADRVSGWHWSSAKGIAVDAGQAFSPHSYGWLMTLPPNALAPNGPANSAPRGYLVLPGNSTMPLVGSDGTGQTAALPIGSSQFQAVGSPFTLDPAHGPAIYDLARRRIVQFNDTNGPTREALDVLTGAISTIHLGGTVYAYSSIGGYNERHDLYMGLRIPASSGEIVGFGFFISDPRTGTLITPTFSGTAPTPNVTGGHHYAIRWSEPLQAWVCYAANGANAIWFLKAPANPRVSSVWTWVRRTFTGTAYSAFGPSNNPPYNRIAVPRESVTDTHCDVLWFPLVNQPTQRIRVARP